MVCVIFLSSYLSFCKSIFVFLNSISFIDLDTSISIPNSDSQHLFAPISPAASTTPAHNSLLEMLRRGQTHQQQQPQHLQAFQHQHKTMG